MYRSPRPSYEGWKQMFPDGRPDELRRPRPSYEGWKRSSKQVSNRSAINGPRPSYEGWKLILIRYDQKNLLARDLPMRDGNTITQDGNVVLPEARDLPMRDGNSLWRIRSSSPSLPATFRGGMEPSSVTHRPQLEREARDLPMRDGNSHWSTT